ncbi:MAG: mechanosensitive ion channel [Paludibacteraceae bacterium]|nr:mechanosensitive ion channel [Paludibacteraceae bacterium]
MNENEMASMVPDSSVVDSVVANVLNPEAVANGTAQEFLSVALSKGADLLMTLGSRILLAIVVLVIGRWIVKKLNKVFSKMMEKRGVEVSLASFLKSLVGIVLNFILIITIIGVLGIETSSFVALFASAGVAIGMALSGTLQNFAGGVMILLFKPFRVGDFVEAQGVVGTIKEIQIFNTVINTLDNKTIIVPNGGLSTGIITNYSKEDTRRVDWVFSVAYGDDYDKAKAVIADLLAADKRVLKDPEPFVALNALNCSSVDLVVRAWVKSPDYWGVFFDMNEQVYKTFSKHGLNIPFPQMDVHVMNNK